MNICDYGCGQEATFQFKNGKWCCHKSFNACPERIRINKETNKDIWERFEHPRGMAGKKSVSWNKGLTKETSEIIKTVSVRQNEYFKTHKGYFTGKKHSEETKRKIGLALKGNKHSKNTRNPDASYNGLKMDSMWEVGYAKFLDSFGFDWKYESETFSLGESESYTPDFIIYKNGKIAEIHEVKGLFREKNKLKFEKFLKQYPQYDVKLLQYHELLELNIINSGGSILGT